MTSVTFLPSFKKIEVAEHSTILAAAQKVGIHMNVVCGGIGKCGKCIVYVKTGLVSFDEKKFEKFLSKKEIEDGACLACVTYIESDIQVLIPEPSLVQEQKILIKVSELVMTLSPSVVKYPLQLPPPSLDDPSPDLSRLLWGVEKKGGPKAELVYAPLEIIRMVPSVLRESGWRVTATIAHIPGVYRLIDLEKGDTSYAVYGAAIDLGTTTIVVYIRNLIDGAIVGIASNYNQQISYGEDILSRVNYAKKEGGLNDLQQLASNSINAVLAEAVRNGGIDSHDIYEVVVAGNTVMTHLLLGINPGYIIAEPYVPVVRRYLTTGTERAGIKVNPRAALFVFPSVSDFIGGDIVADVLATGMSESDEIALMIDIGTNFEIVLGNRDWMFSCAGAAGPALEGGEVLFGMRANPGAIEEIKIDPHTLSPVYRTINQIKPKGICGSGLIDLLAELFKACIIDRTGRINSVINNDRIRKGTHFYEYVVAWEHETGLGKDIVITENDVKNLIMSKASVLAACTILLNMAGITRENIGKIYFSGAFGNYINKENAIRVIH